MRYFIEFIIKKMKQAILFFLIGLIFSVSAVPVQNEIQLKGLTDFLSNLFQQVLLPPLVTAVQDSAGLLGIS